MAVQAISADSHMDLTFLPPDTFISRVPAKFRDRAPRVVDRDGAKAEIIYGIIGISRRLFGVGISDPELLTAVYTAYNDWIAEFGRSAPGRYFGLGCLPNHDALAAAAEARRCAELGLRGASTGSRPRTHVETGLRTSRA